MNKFLKEFKDRGFSISVLDEDELSELLDQRKIKGLYWF